MAVTWKGPRIGLRAKTRREIEVPLPPAPGGNSTLESWTELLEALGFGRVAEVAKRRRGGSVSWQGAEVEVAIDEVAGLGDFLELELIAGEGEVSLALSCLESLAVELGCTAPERRSYLEMLLAGNRPR